MVLADPARQLSASKQDAGRQWSYHFGLLATGSDRLHVQRAISARLVPGATSGADQMYQPASAAVHIRRRAAMLC